MNTAVKRRGLLIIASFIIASLFLNLKKKTSILILSIIHLLNIIFYLIYKTGLTKDEEYAYYCRKDGIDVSCFPYELFPLQLCNMGYIMLPLGLLLNSRMILGYCAMIMPFSTIVAICLGYTGMGIPNLHSKRSIGFYGTHVLLLFEGLVLWFSRLYVPEYIDALTSCLCLLANGLVAHIGNLLLRKYSPCKKSNFLFTIDTEGNALLEILHKLIPVPYLYLLPTAPVYYLYFFVVIFLYKLIF